MRAQDDVALAEAHRLTYAALAADPDLKELDTLFEGIDGARTVLRSQTLTEEDAGVWQLVAQLQEPNDMVQFGRKLIGHGRYAFAQIVLERAADLARQQVGQDGVIALAARHEFALCLGLRGQHKAALSLFRDLWNIRSSLTDFGADHPDTLAARACMAWQLSDLGRHSEALEIFLEVWTAANTSPDIGPDHPDSLTGQVNIADTMCRTGDCSDALTISEGVWHAMKTSPDLGPEHPRTLHARASMAWQLGKLGRYPEAFAIFEEVWQIRMRSPEFGSDHRASLNVNAWAGFYSGLSGDPEGGLKRFTAAWQAEQRPDILGPDHPTHLYRRYMAARLNDLTGQWGSADVYLAGLRDDILAVKEPTHGWVRELDDFLADRATLQAEGKSHTFGTVSGSPIG